MLWTEIPEPVHGNLPLPPECIDQFSGPFCTTKPCINIIFREFKYCNQMIHRDVSHFHSGFFTKVWWTCNFPNFLCDEAIFSREGVFSTHNVQYVGRKQPTRNPTTSRTTTLYCKYIGGYHSGHFSQTSSVIRCISYHLDWMFTSIFSLFRRFFRKYLTMCPDRVVAECDLNMIRRHLITEGLRVSLGFHEKHSVRHANKF